MIDCLDEHIKQKNKICPENVSQCMKKIKLMNLKNHCFLSNSNNDTKKQLEKIHKIKSLLYLMIYKNVPQDLVRYCIKSYL